MVIDGYYWLWMMVIDGYEWWLIMVIDGYYCLLIAIHNHSCFLMVIVRDEWRFINGQLINGSSIVHTTTTRWFNTSNVLKDMSIVAPFHPDHDTSGAQLTYLEVSYSNIL